MLKVVIIDGNAVSRNLLTTVLTNGGHEVIGDFSSNQAGLARAIKLRPQVICIDIGAIEDGGLDLLDTLQQALPKVLIFLVSGTMDAGIVQGALQRGAHGFIVKPFNSVTVLSVIRNGILKMVRQRDAVKPALPLVAEASAGNPAPAAAAAPPDDRPDSTTTGT